MKSLVIKMPTRGRFSYFFETLDIYYSYLSGDNEVTFIISCDEDDSTMNNTEVTDRLNLYSNLKYYFGKSKTKVEAVNANLDKLPEKYDVLLVASDDMIPIKKGYDSVILDSMLKHYPDTDGVLWFNDGFVGKELNTLPIVGKKYYDRFGYIYYHEYKSFFCDGEFTCVANYLNKQVYIDDVIIQHIHCLSPD